MRKSIAIAAAGAVTAALVATGSAMAVTIGSPVTVTMNEFNIMPANQGAKRGSVTFAVRNTGTIEHEFIVLRTTKAAGNLLGGDHGPTRADESGAVGELGSLKAGELKKVTLKLKAGHYSLICNLPGHYTGGQFVDFYVR